MFEDYDVPGSRAPFQNGEYVVVGPRLKYYGAQPKRSYKYEGKIGKVIGQKAVYGSYTKYLLEFNNGEKEAFMASILLGPFDNEQTAKKYEGATSSKVNPQDLAQRITKKIKADYAKKPKTEAALKGYFTKPSFDFEWFDAPLEMTGEGFFIPHRTTSPKQIVFCLGRSKIKPLFAVYRINNRVSKALTDYVYYGPQFNYALQLLKGEFSGHQDAALCDGVWMKDFISNIADNVGAKITWSTNDDPGGKLYARDYEMAMKYSYGKTPIKSVTPEVLKDVLSPFEQENNRYVFKVDVDLNLEAWSQDSLSFLKNATFVFKNNNNNRQVNLTVAFLNKRGNLEGCPSKVEGDFALWPKLKGVESIKGAPQVTGDVYISHTDKVTEEQFREEGKYRNLKDELPELEGIF